MRGQLDVGSCCGVQPGEYEVISLAEEGKHVYTRLDNSRIQNGLHEH